MRYVEMLESRRLLTTVFQGLPGYYEVTGTEGDDAIDIAVNQAAGSFTLDGVTYGGALHITVYALGGNDTVSVMGPGNAVSAAVVGAGGQDKITLNINGAAWGDAEHDEIRLRNAFRGEAYGGAGDDYISLAGECIECQVEGNDGNDIIWALDNNHGVVLFGGAGNDRLYGSNYDDVLFDGPGSDWLFGLGGNDELHARDSSLDWVMGGDGYDTVWCDTVEGGINGCENIFYG
jgi:Ca2+-binding RTX toxin-like protein